MKYGYVDGKAVFPTREWMVEYVYSYGDIWYENMRRTKNYMLIYLACFINSVMKNESMMIFLHSCRDGVGQPVWKHYVCVYFITKYYVYIQ